MKISKLRLRLKKLSFISVLLLLIFIPSFESFSQIPFPNVNLGVSQATTPAQVGLSLQVLLLVAILSLAPSIVIMMTSFVRLAIVFSFVRTALGTQNMPPTQVLMGLSLFLTLFIMSPVLTEIYDNAWKPYSEGKNQPITTLYQNGINPLREFMFKQLENSKEKGVKTLDTFIRLAKIETRPKNKSEVPTYILIPAFMTNEITKAFEMGVNIFIPFLMIDLLVSSVLMAMGMVMLPPVMIALPFKIILFVMIDGWNLIITSVVKSFY